MLSQIGCVTLFHFLHRLLELVQAQKQLGKYSGILEQVLLLAFLYQCPAPHVVKHHESALFQNERIVQDAGVELWHILEGAQFVHLNPQYLQRKHRMY